MFRVVVFVLQSHGCDGAMLSWEQLPAYQVLNKCFALLAQFLVYLLNCLYLSP